MNTHNGLRRAVSGLQWRAAPPHKQIGLSGAPHTRNTRSEARVWTLSTLPLLPTR